MPSVISLSRSRLVGLFSALIFNLLSKCVISSVCSAIQKKPYVEYLLDLFLYESEEEQKAWIAEHTAEITHLEAGHDGQIAHILFTLKQFFDALLDAICDFP